METSEPNQEVFIRGNTLHFGNIQQAPPLMSQDMLHPPHAVTPASPVVQEAIYPSHAVTSTPVVKLEPPDHLESMACQPSLGWERLSHEEQSHPGQSSSSNEALDAPHERESSERQSSVASAVYGIREELLTIADLDQRTLQPSKSQGGESQRSISSRKPDENPDARGPSERHDTSVTSTSTISSPRQIAVRTILFSFLVTCRAANHSVFAEITFFLHKIRVFSPLNMFFNCFIIIFFFFFFFFFYILYVK